MVLQEEKQVLGHPVVTCHLEDTVKVYNLLGITTELAFMEW